MWCWGSLFVLKKGDTSAYLYTDRNDQVEMANGDDTAHWQAGARDEYWGNAMSLTGEGDRTQGKKNGTHDHRRENAESVGIDAKRDEKVFSDCFHF